MATEGNRVTPLDPTADRPLYRQLEIALERRILSGEWGPGAKVPSEPELCDVYHVSRITVRQALASLARRGLVVRGRGKGTFVRDVELTGGTRSVSSFTAEMEQMGVVAGSRLLEVEVVEAGEEVAKALDLPDGAEVVRVVRLRTGDGRPIGVQRTHLVADLVPDLAGHLHDDTSLYGLLRSEYGIVPQEAVETFRVTGVPARWADVMDVARGRPAFDVTRTTHAQRGPFEYTRSILRGDRYQIRLSLRNP